MGVFEAMLEELEIDNRDFQEDHANWAGFDYVGFRGLCVDSLTEGDYLAEKAKLSMPGEHECQE